MTHPDQRRELVRTATSLSDDDLDAELRLSGDPVWIEVLTQEKQHRETGEPI